MKKNCIPLTLILLPVLVLNELRGQERKLEIQLYTAPLTVFEVMYDSDGPLEYGGPSVEYFVKNTLSIGLSGSLNGDESYLWQVIVDNRSHTDGAFDYHIIEKNRIVNFYLKKYTGSDAGTGFFYGGYLRYWYYRNQRLDTDEYSAEYRNYFIINNYPITYSNHKISLGMLAGLKGRFLHNFTYGMFLGGGFSPSFLYLTHEKHFDPKKNTLKRYTTSFTPEHLSILCHAFIGYRF
jgi:hypothetical protein